MRHAHFVQRRNFISANGADLPLAMLVNAVFQLARVSLAINFLKMHLNTDIAAKYTMGSEPVSLP